MLIDKYLKNDVEQYMVQLRLRHAPRRQRHRKGKSKANLTIIRRLPATHALSQQREIG